jgi:O-antigen ligase/tetratricopeptide (TPR) repeat protein
MMPRSDTFAIASLSSETLSSFDWVIHAIVSVMLIFLPFAFGATEAWSQEIFCLLTTSLLLLVTLRAAFDRSASIRWQFAYLPVLLFVLLGLAQLIQWPAGIISAVSPQTTAMRSAFLGEQPDAATKLLHQTFTLYPQATTENLRLVLAVSGIFFVATQFYCTQRKIEQLLISIAVVGLAVSLLAAWQNFTGATTVYGLVPAMHRNSGPFMNYSHFGQFMNLSIGASLGLGLMRWISTVHETRPRFGSLGDVTTFMADRRMWLVDFLAVSIVIEAITVGLSMTRMGTISLIVAGALVAAMLTWRTRSKDKGSVILVLGLLILAAVLCVGFDAIYERLATVRQIETAQGGRLEMLRDIFAIVKLFPIIGTGLGTHEYVFPMFDHSSILALATHAENEFAQLLEESGIVGLLLALSFLTIIAAHFAACVRKPERPIQYVAFGLGFSLIAIIIHSFSDFGQHVPANAVLTACCCGTLINISNLSVSARAGVAAGPNYSGLLPKGSALRFQIIRRCSLALVFLAAGAWCVAGTDAARAADAAWGDAMVAALQLHDQHWQGDDNQYIALLTPATLATRLQPLNIKYRYWLNMYRWKSLSRPQQQRYKTFELSVAALPYVSRVVDDLLTTQNLCPTFGPAYSLAGELDHFVLGRPEGIKLIQSGFKLSPKDPIAGFISGELALDDHRVDEALADFRSAAQAGADKRDAIELLVHKANRPDLAYQFAAKDAASLTYLVELLSNSPADQQLVARCRRDLQDLLQAAADQPTASPDTMAALADQYAIQGNDAKAIAYLRKALASDYSRVDWHYRLANLLAESGDQAGGMGEARVCLRIRPQMKEAETLLGNLSVQSSVRSGVQ